MKKAKIFQALNKDFIQKFFEKKKKIFFPSKKGKILRIEIKRASPDWAERTCLVRYKIFFSDGTFKIVRGTAKTDGSRKWSYQVMKYFYENNFNKGKFLVPKPLAYLENIKLFLYEEAQGEPLSLMIDKKKYSLKLSKDVAKLLFKIHSLKKIKFKKKALLFGQKDYLKTYQRIKKIFPQISNLFPLKKLGLIQKLNEPFSFIHGDFYTGNLIIRKNEIILIDFDKAGQGPILYDLASFCYCFEFPKSIWPLNLSKAEVNKYQNTFLKSYAELASWDLFLLKGVLNKYLAKVFLNALNYYTGLAYEGWSLLTKKEKRNYFIQIKDLLRKANQYFKKYESFIRSCRMCSFGESGGLSRCDWRLAPSPERIKN